jgi:hypothetical protein
MQIAFNPLNPEENAWVLRVLREIPAPARSTPPVWDGIPEEHRRSLESAGVVTIGANASQIPAAGLQPGPITNEAPANRTRTKKAATVETDPIGPVSPATVSDPAKPAEPAPAQPQQQAPAPLPDNGLKTVTVDEVRTALAIFVDAKMKAGIPQDQAAALAKAIILKIGLAQRLADVPLPLLPAVLREAEAGAK